MFWKKRFEKIDTQFEFFGGLMKTDSLIREASEKVIRELISSSEELTDKSIEGLSENTDKRVALLRKDLGLVSGNIKSSTNKTNKRVSDLLETQLNVNGILQQAIDEQQEQIKSLQKTVAALVETHHDRALLTNTVKNMT